MTTPTQSSPAALTAAIEATRSTLHAYINQACDELMMQLVPIAPAKSLAHVAYKKPAIEDGHDPRNKNGQNLTPRGVEILYRVFDDDGGYNRASKMLNITQAAAKNRKSLWVKAGGKERQKAVLDIDSTS